ncbi:ImmA/IrrE family metallo-endopeptidase [Nitrosomonas sp. Is37]|uniref:ImmA/IrrE family metallo-endopeptidase n=1 Tax=Nitrosomonas sp. Is37 TaxID=3080535 RepID=UPI00294B65E4|nr:ImmA/IrrE family metallo-endopeptidase [Nitrosomonas sp. Is37]MDV6343146.1 ImmA/IrrE family metallo-endopeptidase [Nitrosomonas sp. Is37]
MDTITKGNKLENDVYKLFSEMISEGRFFAKSECCQIYKKKGYYSKDREKEIVFDISIEITLPGQSTRSLLVLIECKNYDYKVPVDDVEEFFAKSQQISPSNTKTIVVSTNAFQEGAFNFARSKGMGLLRYFDSETLDWVLTRSPSSMTPWSTAKIDSSSAHQGLHLQDYASRYFDCYGFVGDIYTNSLNQFFSRLVRFGADENLAESLAEIEQGLQPSDRLVPYKEREEIEALCRETLHKANYTGGVVPLDQILKFLSRNVGLEVRRDSSLATGVLGVISFDPLIIQIDEVQARNEQRTRFTLAHELGHLLLDHQRYMRRESCHESNLDLDSPGVISIKDIIRMEWQANCFASCLLLPRERLVKSFLIEAARYSLVDRGHGLLYLDDQRCNVDAFYAVTAPIMSEFNVSRSVVKIRLKQLGFLIESEVMPNKLIQSTENHCALSGQLED